MKTPVNQSDKLVLLQRQAAKARDLELEIATYEEGAKACKELLKELQNDKMPSLMDELKLDRIGVPPEGNKPGIDYKLVQQIGASIASSWATEKRQQAFDVLKKYKAESLIKTEVTSKLPKGSLPLAKKLVAAAKALKVTAELKQTVHAGTLSAWLKEIYEGGQSLSQSDLEKIGGYVGRVVKAEERE
jgi:hypothetical protein